MRPKRPLTVLPQRIRTEQELDEILTRPSPELESYMRTLHGPLVVLGAGGKMGPSLCVMAQRAARASGNDLDLIAVSRFSSPESRSWLEGQGIRTLSCDLMDRGAVADLPDAKHVVYLVGLKFGTSANPALTWAVNTLIPAYVAERYAGVPVAALSTGNVYPPVPVDSGGSVESDALTPLGEYSNAAVARERIFEFVAKQHETPIILIRLNYAAELRYGVLVDIARTIRNEGPVDVTVGYLNCIWQGDANEMILRALDLAECPAAALNLTGTDKLSVRDLARRLGELMDLPVHIRGSESPQALLSNAARMQSILGTPRTSIDQMLEWTAGWIRGGGATMDKPTHFQVSDGRY